MTAFDAILIVDWSGGADRGPAPKADAIWAICQPISGPETAPIYLRNRVEATDFIYETLNSLNRIGDRVLAGFDFPFGYPQGFAKAITGTPDPLALWDIFARDLPEGACRFALADRLNARFPGIGPFWFNGRKLDLPHLPRKGRDRRGHGLPDRRAAERLAKGSFSCWQMGGAGAVGSQAMTGQAALSRLRYRLGPDRVAVWPFQPCAEAGLVLAEVWPSLLAPQIAAARRPDEVKDAAQVRVLAGVLARMVRQGSLASLLDAPLPTVAAEEGWILGLGPGSALAAAAQYP